MDIRVEIQKNQIHHWVDVPVYNSQGNQTGTKEVLQFGMKCIDYPDLPTYGIKVDYPIDQAKILTAIQEKLTSVQAQIVRDNTIRASIEGMGYLNFTVTI